MERVCHDRQELKTAVEVSERGDDLVLVDAGGERVRVRLRGDDTFGIVPVPMPVLQPESETPTLTVSPLRGPVSVAADATPPPKRGKATR